MRIRMNVDYSYCPDGITLKHVKQNDVEDAPECVARVLLADGRAREDKMLDVVPATKVGPQSGATGHKAGPSVTIEVKRGTSPYEVPPAGTVPAKPKLAKKR
jgi:hypothetical protein